MGSDTLFLMPDSEYLGQRYPKYQFAALQFT